ncbi:sensor histidine kinase [Ruminococcus sp.]|uniref:sensor histidine kinase n=1 Tax=Ruminococcus sp. TaxID=41978 RepID=UPI00388FD432
MKKLRKKIVIGVFFSALVVFALTILFVAIAINAQITRRTDGMTRLIVTNNGRLPEKSEYEKLEVEDQLRLYNYNEESPYRMRYFSVSFLDDNIVSADLKHIKAVDESSAIMMADAVMMTGETTGNYDYYRYRVSDNRQLVVFVDCTEEYYAVEVLVLILSVIALGVILMITLVFWFLSHRIVKPFEENSRMQKQFITDASHELKTPLAIISANAEVLAYKSGENEWINNITTQVSRVSELVNELLTLNRLEEVDEITDIEPVDLSRLTTDISGSFEEVFKGKHAAFLLEIEPDVTINGNASQLERLVSVLVENASKYVTENGEFRLVLKKEARYTDLTVFNSCETDPTINYQHLFDRFYRPDSSRTSSTGGHGIGLSIAKRIVTLHGGTIEAVPGDGGLSFNVRLSNRLKAGKQKGSEA